MMVLRSTLVFQLDVHFGFPFPKMIRVKALC